LVVALLLFVGATLFVIANPFNWGVRKSARFSFQAPGATGNADAIRVMGPTAAYPNGYVRIYNEHGQPVTIDGKPLGRPETHLPSSRRPKSRSDDYR
jgi:hypothetical protein